MIPAVFPARVGSVVTDADSEKWRKKYFDSLSSLEGERQKYLAMETTMRRLTTRLCTAALGQSRQLDEQIKKLQGSLRREAGSDELEQLTPALTEAIQTLDDLPSAAVAATAAVAPAAAQSTSTPVASPEAIVADGRVRATLAALLGELKRDTDLVGRANELDSKLAASMTQEKFSEVLGALTEMVGQRIKRIELAKEEVEGLLSHMVGKLDEIGQFVAEQNQSQSQSQASSETLNMQLSGEMRAMGESVESAADLQQIRWQVRSRLESIDRHLQEFREREEALASAARERSEKMRERIVELEAEAKRLQSELKDEQRLSTVDALTKIPNRLAYEKRIEEELQRWQRFKQPTCIAVWDVDYFKRVNDTYGHRAGDRVLHTVAECLSRRIRSTDFIARYGGEEFVMILPGTSLGDAIRLVDEMRIAISQIGFHFRQKPVSITVSSGVTALLGGDSAGTAFDRADKALYQAKESGRNRCVSI